MRLIGGIAGLRRVTEYDGRGDAGRGGNQTKRGERRWRAQ
jgi:hypothetical protein